MYDSASHEKTSVVEEYRFLFVFPLGLFFGACFLAPVYFDFLRIQAESTSWNVTFILFHIFFFGIWNFILGRRMVSERESSIPYTIHKIEFQPFFKNIGFGKIFKYFIPAYAVTIIATFAVVDIAYVRFLALVVPWYVLISIVFSLRIEYMVNYPLEFMKNNKVRLKVGNYNMSSVGGLGDSDLIERNGIFALLMDCPGSEAESESVYLMDNITFGKPSLVASLNIKGLAAEIRNGTYCLDAKLIRDEDDADWEVELCLRKV